MDALLHTVLQQPFTDPSIQPADNASRMINLPNGENLFTNGKLISEDIPESSIMGERKQSMIQTDR